MDTNATTNTSTRQQRRPQWLLWLGAGLLLWAVLMVIGGGYLPPVGYLLAFAGVVFIAAGVVVRALRS